MRTRADHLQWAKERAVAVLRTPGLAFEQAKMRAIECMIRDLQAWEGGTIVSGGPMYLAVLAKEAMDFRDTPKLIEEWIKRFK